MSIKREQLIAEITASVTNAMKLEMENYACPLLSDQKKAVTPLFTMFEDIGNGDLKRGVRRMRRFFAFTDSLYNKKTVITGTVFTTTILVMVGFGATFLWNAVVSGFKTMAGGQP